MEIAKVRTEKFARKILANRPELEKYLRKNKLILKFIESIKAAGAENGLGWRDVMMMNIIWRDCRHIHDWQKERHNYNKYLEEVYAEF